MHWKLVALTICAYGLLKEFKPIEPYLYRYQHTFLNISGEVLNSQVYPLWTYSYLLLSIPTMLLTDLLLYKPDKILDQITNIYNSNLLLLLLESVAYICVWLTLIFGRSVLTQQIGQVLFGVATATEVAYFAYIYVKVDKRRYARVTAWTRAALQFGKCFSYLLAQLLLLFSWGDYLTLNYISLVSLSCTFLFASALPFVHWRELVQIEIDREKSESIILKTRRNNEQQQQQQQVATVPSSASGVDDNDPPPSTYLQFAAYKVRNFWKRAKVIYSDGLVLKWSVWWAMATCGDLQVGNYVQLLWEECQRHMQNYKIYNGFVEGTIPLLAALTIVGMQRVRVNWSRWGELALCLTACVEFLILLAMSQSASLYAMYAGYAVVRILYQMSITVAQFNIASRIDVSSGGFVFGLNMFIALSLQTVLTLLVADARGPFRLSIRPQFVVYSVYHALISAIFLFSQLRRLVVAHRCQQ